MVTATQAPAARPQAPQNAQRRTVAPRANVFETEQTYVVAADVPGVEEKDLEVTVEKNVLTIRGKTQPAPEGYQLAYAEYNAADYERHFTLGDQVDTENIEAQLKDGVLTLTLPKRQEVVARQIDIKAA